MKDNTYYGAGIYGLFDVVNYKIYIGKSKRIPMRFAQHRKSFEEKSPSNSMYSEPVNNFAFVILNKMTDEEFKKYGDLMEIIYIAQAIQSGLPIYNKNKIYKDITFLILAELGTENNLKSAIEKATGSKIGYIKQMSKATRSCLLR